MDENNRNFLLAILLSIGVLFAWQYFFVPQHPPATKAPTEQSQQQQQQQQQAEPGPPRPGAQSETPSAGGPTPPGAGHGDQR
jgi:YidC/Oxa1 family membrane protein insertase